MGNEFNILYSGCRNWRLEVIAVKYAVWLLEYLLCLGSMKYLLASGISCNCWNNNCYKVVTLHGTKAYVKRRGITPLINRSATWRWVVNFMTCQLYTQGKHPWYQWKQRQPSELVWRFREENFLPMLGIKTWFFSWTCSLVTILYAPLCLLLEVINFTNKGIYGRILLCQLPCLIMTKVSFCWDCSGWSMKLTTYFHPFPNSHSVEHYVNMLEAFFVRLFGTGMVLPFINALISLFSSSLKPKMFSVFPVLL